MSFITFEDTELMKKIRKSIKFKPHFKIVEDMKAEAEEIRKKAFQEGERKGKKEGLSQGKIIGSSKEKVDIARNLINMDMGIDVVMKATGLTADDIDDLKNEMGL